MNSKIALVLTLTLVLSVGIATPASAGHPCLDADTCPSHDPPSPKQFIETIRCLILAQPPTACV